MAGSGAHRERGRIADCSMYEEYYGFVQPPFSLTPDPRFLYRSESHDIALQQVWQAIRRKEGFIVLTGDIGTGKTTLCRTILEQFDPTTFTALILNPFLSVDELLREVLLSFGVASRDALRTGRLGTASKHELIRVLHDFLLSLVPLHGSAVLIIDEAQHLSPDVLEEIRILSNLETNEQKLLQILLVGQLNLLDVLHNSQLRQLDQRISIRCLLKPLNREEVEAYITHRLWVARGSSVAFSPKALDLVHALTGGVPRMINLVCDRALMVGCAEKTDKISDAFVRQAADVLGLAVPRNIERRDRLQKASQRALVAAGLLVVLAALAGASYTMYQSEDPFTLLGEAEVPQVAPAPARQAPPAITPLAIPESSASLDAPPAESGAFSVLVGTYDTPRQALLAEATIRTDGLQAYAVDTTNAAGQRQRRLLVGRFATRAEAVAAQQKLAATFPSARVILGWQERMRNVP